MALTITNTNTIHLLSILNKNTTGQSNILRQLATGKRINAGKDDPAGLIALSQLNMERTAVEQALINNQRTDTMLTVADSAFEEMNSLLQEIETLVVASTSDANLTASEIAANQSQIDNALAAMDRIVRTTIFNGKTLLDGSFGIQTAGVGNNSNIDNLRVFSRSQSTSESVLTVTRVTSAQLATVVLQADTVVENGGLTTSGATTLVITGALGTATITLADGLTKTGMLTAINAATDQTGVTAVLSNVAAGAIAGASGINLNSAGFGSDAFVSVEVLSGGGINTATGTGDNSAAAADDLLTVGKTLGVDAAITINGQTAGTDGLDANYSANGLSLSFTLGSDFGSGNTAATTSSFTVKASGGATFQLGTTAATRATIGIDSLATYKLGGGNGTARLSELKSGGTVDLNSDPGGALATVREALGDLASTRGRIGGFQKYQVGSSINSLQASNVGLSEAARIIGDTDFAWATAELNRFTVLIQSGISLLGVANQQAAQILSLL